MRSAVQHRSDRGQMQELSTVGKSHGVPFEMPRCISTAGQPNEAASSPTLFALTRFVISVFHNQPVNTFLPHLVAFTCYLADWLAAILVVKCHVVRDIEMSNAIY